MPLNPEPTVSVDVAEARLGEIPPGWQVSTDQIRPWINAVLAELARQRGLIAAVLAECDDWNPWTTTINEAQAQIRVLLGGGDPNT